MDDEVTPIPPEIAFPVRVLVAGAAQPAWYDASDTERREAALPRFQQLLVEWSERGATLIASFDDEFFTVGPPATANFSFYLLYEVPDFETIVWMIQRLRITVNGVRLDKYIRMEARSGVKLFLAER